MRKQALDRDTRVESDDKDLSMMRPTLPNNDSEAVNGEHNRAEKGKLGKRTICAFISHLNCEYVGNSI